jgi:16S rRNA (guanine(966)-N(2))-methyltransferase RsmD
VRTSVFDLLGAVPEGARVLDLFAGTGALGIEALSRGAGTAALVETDAAALRALRANVASLGLEDRVRIVGMDALAAIDRLEGPFDLVFLDPPYRTDLAQQALPRASHVVAAGGVAVLEQDAREAEVEAPRGMNLWKSRRYGTTRITLYRKEDA